MKSLIFLLLFTAITVLAYSQNNLGKAQIDTSNFASWPILEGSQISNDGKNVLFAIKNPSLGKSIFILFNTSTNTEIVFHDIKRAYFSDNSQHLIYLKSNDTLCIFSMGINHSENIPNISSYQLIKYSTGERLVYTRKNPENKLVIRDLSDGKEKVWDLPLNYVFDYSGNAFVTIETVSVNSQSLVNSINLINLLNGKETKLWQGDKVSKIVFDANSSQLAFSVDGSNSSTLGVSIWYYKIDTDSAILLINDNSPGIDKGLKVGGISYLGFSRDGSNLFVDLKEVDSDVKTPKDEAQPLIWNYKDNRLPTEQLFNLKPRNYRIMISPKNKKIIRIENNNERLVISNSSPIRNINDDYLLIENDKVSASEKKWKAGWEPRILINTKTRSVVWKSTGNYLSPKLSPDGKYVIFYDSQLKNYYSYDIVFKSTKNITKDIKASWLYENNELETLPNSIAGWLKGDSAVFVYDKHDIWVIDPACKKPPFNLTNGYGKKHSIVFRFSENPLLPKIIGPGEDLLISAFNTKTKNNGFFKKNMSENGDPKLLTMGPYIYYIPDKFLGSPPKKARDVNAWIVTRMSAKESPNYYYTNDFNQLTPLSHLQPELAFNWYRTELHTYKDSANNEIQGILYVPENFNSKVRYPVIIHCYEERSYRLNLFISPKPTSGSINIPWFINQGYLIFEPDIRYKIGHAGESALNSVISAFNYLSKLPYINSSKIGLQGHSFGAFEVNYIITHANLFAAACSASGASDFVSYYGSLFDNGASQQSQFESGQYRMGGSLWDKQDLYVKNSPIFNANKVNSPLLIMHTKKDGGVPFSQAVELFTALRRLGKKTWMLQYDCCDHSLEGLSAIDFTLRVTQFFDHYLKDRPAPFWMTKGIPAKLKGITSGFELDLGTKMP